MHQKKRNPLIALGIATAVVPTTLLFIGVNPLFFIPLLVGIVIYLIGIHTSDKTVINWAVAAAVCAWIGPVVLTGYFTREGPPIEFVVPNDFRGTIEIIRDRNDGDDLKFEQGRCVFVIPPSGILRIKEAYVFHRWHTETCHDFDGNTRNLVGQGTTSGDIQTGPNSYKGSTDYDGTTYRWEVRWSW